GLSGSLNVGPWKGDENDACRLVRIYDTGIRSRCVHPREEALPQLPDRSGIVVDELPSPDLPFDGVRPCLTRLRLDLLHFPRSWFVLLHGWPLLGESDDARVHLGRNELESAIEIGRLGNDDLSDGTPKVHRRRVGPGVLRGRDR